MSLLLEALKKAEKAKEDAQRRANTDGGGGDPDGTIAQPSRPLMTRDQLPEISQQLEIVSEEMQLAPEPPQRESRPESQRTAPQRPPPAARAPEAQSPERATARKVFEVKFKEPNPKLPFYITMGSLGAFALGTVVYFYFQLRPPPALVNANPPRTAAESAAPAVADARPVASAAAPAGAQPIPGLPTGAASKPMAGPVPVQHAPSRATPAIPRAQPQSERPRLAPRPAQETRTSQPATQVDAGRSAPQVHPQVEAGYAAYQAGDAAAARNAYQQALAENPANRDALLGIAALDVRAGRFEPAEASYLRLLQADPRDSYAHAALIALRGGRQDPLVAESRVKSLLAADPGAHVLNFALGNQFAAQGRWAEAQQEYFKAASAEPDNPDFAYNLAVSLDQLRQPRLAREHYLRAIALADRRGASFDLAAARTRAAQLGQ